MSIREIFQVIGADVTEGGQVPVSALQKPKILSIGGCVTEILAGRMNRLADVTHLWRVSVPCMMSKKIEGRTYFESDDNKLSDRINFELTKQALRKLKAGGYAFLIFDPTSDFTNDYYEKDGCIISDMESPMLAPNWKWPSGFIESGWGRISPRSHQYLEIYLFYLKELVKLSEEIGVPLVIMRRRACANTITRDGVVGLGDSDSPEINWWVDLLWEKIGGLLGKLNVLDLNGRFSVTSFDAPYGEAKFHPIEEFYDYAAYKLMGLMRFSDDLISEVAFNVYRERASRRLAIHSEREGLIHERDGLLHERDGLIRERDGLTQERDGLVCERDRLVHEREYLIQERDNLRHDRDELRLSLDNLAVEQECIQAREIEKARIANECHRRELAVFSEAQEAASAENAANLLALKTLQENFEDLSRKHNELCAQQSRLFNELRLEGGPMALRDVLPLARAWRPIIRIIGRVKRFCRRSIGGQATDCGKLHGQ
ncbi:MULTISPECIES: hypothetical protein [Burkholderia]|uniref:Uncharacterized protein n=2 Tax=Burkholderia cenocepacia TaxID=95486 RepID=A0ABD4UHS3_9BURK|nr:MULTISPECIES: hypothetical protein [Burkholderia]MCW3697120.1 hypothetical protein [Burkholderia cenocepacia]MCW3704854.1 hypothetical protein [Burkholderia cenocepacia]MCW3714045.1 hypothetical protein [Burkholderia cenocepacia]MCW3723627.1 hypothetical protein [Burkholderia cenocepacia]MCW3731984.1 hypothetical protein [Burkholderia cenocepacia]